MAGCREDPGTGIHNRNPDSGTFLPVLPDVTPLTESDVDGVARLYTTVFLADEPTTHLRSPDPVMFHHYATLYVRSLAGKNNSFVSRDERTRLLSGFILCLDLTDDLQTLGEWMPEFLSHFPEAVALITELEDRYLNRAGITPGSVLHICQIGVDRKYRRTGIAPALICRVLSHAREGGFRQVIADCTHAGSRHSFEACGFYEAGSLSYETFSVDGVRYFAGLEGGISLMVRDL